jgi:hypothetical protein
VGVVSAFYPWPCIVSRTVTLFSRYPTTDRVWCLTFSDVYSSVSAEKWPWNLTLQLGEHSSPAWVDGRLVITRHSPAPAASGQSSTIPIPLKCHWRLLRPLPTRSISYVLDKNVTDRCVVYGVLADGHSSYNSGLLASLHLLMRPVPLTCVSKPSFRSPWVVAAWCAKHTTWLCGFGSVTPSISSPMIDSATAFVQRPTRSW